MQPGLFEPEDDPSALPPLPERVGRATVAERPRSAIFTRGKGRTAGYDYTLNPYTGCGFGCSYCYAAFFVADEERRARWGEWVDVKSRAEREILGKRRLKDARVYMSSATDPYQPVEAKVGLTRRIVELMAAPERQPRLVVQTRSPLVARDVDVLRRYAAVRVNMSITTDDDAVRRRFEPWCASIDRRFEALETVAAAGIPIAVCVSPMLPISDPEAFALRLARLNAAAYVSSRFHDTKGAFAAGTREPAFAIAAEMGWDDAARHEALAAMRRILPALNGDRNAFAPA